MSHDRDLTILLTLKDRAAFTFRWMAYADRIRLPFKVLIADGGADESVPRALADRNRYPNVEYEYVRYPYDAAYLDYYAKMANALGRVKTSYVVMADNDDFFVTRGLRQCVDFLSANPDYASCGGQGAIFWFDPSLGSEDEQPYGQRVQWKYTSDFRSIDDERASDRVLGQASSTSDSYYDVKRTEEAKRQFGIVRDLGLCDLFMVELLVQFLSVIAGRAKRFDTIHIARQHDSPGSSGSEHQRKYGDWLGRMLVGSWSDDFAKFLGSAAECLSAADRIPSDEAQARMLSAYRTAVTPALLSDLLDDPTVTPAMLASLAVVRRLVRRPEDSRVRRFIRSLYRRSRWISVAAVRGTGFIARIPSAGADFAPIRDFLTRKR